MPVAIAAIDDVAAVLGDRRADAGFDQFLDLVDDVGVGRVFLEAEVVGDSMPAAVPGVNSGAPLTKWSSRVSSTTGSRSVHDTPGAAVTETKSRPKKTPSTMPLSKQRRGQRRGVGGFGIGEVAGARFHHRLAGKELARRRVGRVFGADQHGAMWL